MNEKDEITYFHGRTNRYLEHSPRQRQPCTSRPAAGRYQIGGDTRPERIQEQREDGDKRGNTGPYERGFILPQCHSQAAGGRLPVSDVMILFDEKKIPGQDPEG